jgi:hypothetical protein
MVRHVGEVGHRADTPGEGGVGRCMGRAAGRHATRRRMVRPDLNDRAVDASANAQFHEPLVLRTRGRPGTCARVTTPIALRARVHHPVLPRSLAAVPAGVGAVGGRLAGHPHGDTRAFTEIAWGGHREHTREALVCNLTQRDVDSPAFGGLPRGLAPRHGTARLRRDRRRAAPGAAAERAQQAPVHATFR